MGAKKKPQEMKYHEPSKRPVIYRKKDDKEAENLRAKAQDLRRAKAVAKSMEGLPTKEKTPMTKEEIAIAWKKKKKKIRSIKDLRDRAKGK